MHCEPPRVLLALPRPMRMLPRPMRMLPRPMRMLPRPMRMLPRTDPKDGRVRTLDQVAQIRRHAREGRLARVELGDVLAHAYHADDLVVGVAPRGRVEKDLDAAALLVLLLRPLLGVERELEVRSLFALESVVEDLSPAAGGATRGTDLLARGSSQQWAPLNNGLLSTMGSSQ